MKELRLDFDDHVLTFESNDKFDLIEVTLPDFLYRYGQPRQCNYMNEKGLGIEYVCDVEVAIEINANVLCCHLFSPYVVGWALNNYIEHLELVEIDLHHKKSMIVKLDKACELEFWQDWKKKRSRKVLRR